MGGGIGILQAAVEPDSVAGLVLTSSVLPRAAGRWPASDGGRRRSRSTTLAIGERVDQHPDACGWIRSGGSALGYRMVAADPDSIPEEIVQMDVALVRERQDDPDAPAAFLDAARSMLRLGKRPDVVARAMEGVQCPVLVLHGRRDRFVPAAFAEATLRRFPTWRGRIFPDLGHAPQMEAPGRWLAEVADWYAERVT